jgi:hypothetical protein
MLSVSPPAAHGTIILMARSGYCALAGRRQARGQQQGGKNEGQFFHVALSLGLLGLFIDATLASEIPPGNRHIGNAPALR